MTWFPRFNNVLRMNELNDENLLRIFGFLEVGDLSSARQTCKRWCHVTDDYTLWRSFCYSLRLSDRRVFKFSRRSSSSSPQAPSSPESEPAPSALSKLAFKLEKFDLEPLASNWKVLYRRLRVRHPIFSFYAEATPGCLAAAQHVAGTLASCRRSRTLWATSGSIAPILACIAPSQVPSAQRSGETTSTSCPVSVKTRRPPCSLIATC